MRRATPLALPTAAALLVVIAVATSTHHRAPLQVVVALVLAPLATWATAAAARRVAGPRFATAAAWVYAALPLLGIAYSLVPYRHIFKHEALPTVVGLHRPWLLALGVGCAAAFAFAPTAVVAAAGVVAAIVAVVAWGVHPLDGLRSSLHESAWSITLGEWALVAGVIGIGRRAPLLAVGAAGWLAFAVLRGSAVGYGGGGFWKALALATPVLALTVTALVLLVPPLRARSASVAG
jgi:hypothetical protein